ncbi:hypothetical protein [Limosilactobacillus reuteri]|uniref:hypothetical protein n=1 Tax=Limosilactobacillus reuteri TaxID=1598 RepID=UPI001E64A56A|nr:hypothetical protein [Limosilactobacillus reuteri]MCC4327156.1 hypothetical protein [Limosilactobacillus reuteri]MCC4336177.1 hypothetical protein [Limosilactobacillus reuteri]MCC4338724.1 hypothetical protein [Limosilactobacillus reuteri]MCC4470549.1 hypothetical protein [Limosilactobacillus reuteri]MDY3300044.1 hypothetical protein [Limosilactobacillus reuteri]
MENEDLLKIEKSLFSDTSKYRDIINTPRHVSQAHTPMTTEDRAAQFSPFAALTGYHQLLAKVGKKYGHKTYPTAEMRHRIRVQLAMIERGRSHPLIKVEFFNGKTGFYEEYTGQLKRIDHHAHHLIFDDGTRLIIQNIRKIKRDQQN